MGADNYIEIIETETDIFDVWYGSLSYDDGRQIAKGLSLRDAYKFVQHYIENNLAGSLEKGPFIRLMRE